MIAVSLADNSEWSWIQPGAMPFPFQEEWAWRDGGQRLLVIAPSLKDFGFVFSFAEASKGSYASSSQWHLKTVSAF